jgi:hypothetical protein
VTPRCRRSCVASTVASRSIRPAPETTTGNGAVTPMSSGLRPRHKARFRSRIRPRSAKDTPAVSYSSRCQSTPTPNFSRPPESTSIVAAVLARSAGLLTAPSRIRIVNWTCDVSALRYAIAARGSSHDPSGPADWTPPSPPPRLARPYSPGRSPYNVIPQDDPVYSALVCKPCPFDHPSLSGLGAHGPVPDGHRQRYAMHTDPRQFTEFKVTKKPAPPGRPCQTQSESWARSVSRESCPCRAGRIRVAASRRS